MKSVIHAGTKRRSPRQSRSRSLEDYFPPQTKKAAIFTESPALNEETKEISRAKPSPFHTTKTKATAIIPCSNKDAEQWCQRLQQQQQQQQGPTYLTLDGKSWYLLVKKWMPTPSRQVFEREWALHPKQRHELQVFGRKVLEKRWSQSWGVSYAYSGATNAARPIQESTILPTLLNKINALANDTHYNNNNNNENKDSNQPQQPQVEGPYNGCLQNWYTPDDSIGLHADDEKSMRKDYPIFSLTWGGPRRFVFRPKKVNHTCNNEVVELLLEDGDLLLMGGTCQETHKHEVPKVRKTKDPPTSNRINFTVRAFC